ncbi:MAG: ribonuclease III [Armatimonadota bacterium]
MNKNKLKRKSEDKLLEYLSKKFGFTPGNKDIYVQALTHESYCYENKINKNLSYEKLEFLGDSVLNLVITRYLYDKYPKLVVGDISKCKSRIVSGSILFDIAKKLKLGNYLFLGRGEEAGGGRQRQSILADAFEALIGAIYLDAGLDITHKFVIYFYKNIIKESMTQDFDYKSILQEKIQDKYKELPEYRTLKESGPAHQKTFEVAVYHRDKKLGKGISSTKKEAEQLAAKQALEKFD